MKKRRFKFNLQLFGGGSSTTVQNTSTYTPSEYELQLQKAQADYAEAISPNSLWLNDTARSLLEDSLGTVQVDYDTLNSDAQNQISTANSNNQSLANGQLSDTYLQNMQDAVSSTLTNTVGSKLNSLANNGVLNSSVTTQALNDINTDAANSVASNYLNSLSTANSINNSNISNATSGITTAAAAQEAAQEPAITLWNASLGLNGSTTSALAAAAGKGTTSSTSTTSGSSGGLLSGLLGGL